MTILKSTNTVVKKLWNLKLSHHGLVVNPTKFFTAATKKLLDICSCIYVSAMTALRVFSTAVAQNKKKKSREGRRLLGTQKTIENTF